MPDKEEGNCTGRRALAKLMGIKQRDLVLKPLRIKLAKAGRR